MLHWERLAEPVNAAYFALITFTFVVAIVRGRREERVAAAGLPLMLATLLLDYPPQIYGSMVAIESLAVLVSFGWVAFTVGFNWSLFGTAFAFVAAVFSAPMLLMPFSAGTHSALNVLVGLFQILAMLCLCGAALKFADRGPRGQATRMSAAVAAA